MSIATERGGRRHGLPRAAASTLGLMLALAAWPGCAADDWQDEPVPEPTPEQAPFYRQVVVERIAVRARAIDSSALGQDEQQALRAAIADDFGLALRPIGPLVGLSYFEFALPRRIGYFEAAKRCHRMVRLGDAEECRPRSVGGGLL